MLIYFDANTRFSWLAEPVQDQRDIKPVFDQLGFTGIMFLLEFGHPWSEFSYILDEAERNKAVIKELADRKLGDGRNKDKFPDAFYKTDECRKAIVAINRLMCTPDHTRLYDIKKQEANFASQVTQSGIYEKDPEKRAKNLDADMKGLKALEIVRKQVREEETFVNKVKSLTGMISLDQMMENWGS